MWSGVWFRRDHTVAGKLDAANQKLDQLTREQLRHEQAVMDVRTAQLEWSDLQFDMMMMVENSLGLMGQFSDKMDDFAHQVDSLRHQLDRIERQLGFTNMTVQAFIQLAHERPSER